LAEVSGGPVVGDGSVLISFLVHFNVAGRDDVFSWLLTTEDFSILDGPTPEESAEAIAAWIADDLLEHINEVYVAEGGWWSAVVRGPAWCGLSHRWLVSRGAPCARAALAP